MMFLLGLILGVAIGYLFKPQIKRFLNKLIQTIKENQNQDKVE